MQLWFSCVQFCVKIVAHINTLVKVYEERVLRMQRVPRFSPGMDPLYCDQLGLGFRASFFLLPRITARPFFCDHF